jgi:4-amino-4-deoxychorismate synthase (2-amino-4-deoxychorismate-forming) component I
MLKVWPRHPDLLALHASQPDRYPALFATGGQDGWHILFAFPDSIRRFDASRVAEAAVLLPPINLSVDDAADTPFKGGWLINLSYELGGILEPRIGQTADDQEFPLLWLARIPAAILQRGGQTWLMAESGRGELIDGLSADLARLGTGSSAGSFTAPAHIVEEPEQRFLDGLKRIQQYIAEGDVFQVNLSRAWQVEYAEPIVAPALYGSLMRCNPAPFSALLDMGDWKIVSASPERLVRVEKGGRVFTRPIAGTHPRSTSSEIDNELRQALAIHPKERAEHVMLVDLERNDLGRICLPGTVRVDALMELASYPHLHHIESTVSGQLSSGVLVWDVIRALFPGGTITGCPKVRTMEIIREIERQPRRAYTGSLGYINHDGSLDLNILIRSFLFKGRELRFRTGAGIVADSNPEAELEETRTKAMGLLRTLNNDFSPMIN